LQDLYFQTGDAVWPVQRNQFVIEITIRVRLIEERVEITEVT